MARPFPTLTPEEAAALIPEAATIGFSGFTPAGSPKAIPQALARRAEALAAEGHPMQLRILTGASTGPFIDEALAEAGAISWRAPFQSSRALRRRINAEETEFIDIHLSHVPQMIAFGFLGEIDVAIVEALDVTPDGRVFLTTASGIAPSVLRHAEHILIEINQYPSRRLQEMHDIAILPRPPARHPIQIHHPLSKLGTPFATVDPTRIVGIVETNQPDGVTPLSGPDPVSEAIAGHVVQFLMDELQAGRIPRQFLPLQAGVGNVSNAVMASLGQSAVPPFYMYTEVLQDSQVDLMEQGRLLGASTCGLTLSETYIQRVYADMSFFAPRLVIRPQELSNNPEIIRRLGVIGINTALEVDLYGHVNSTHVAGAQLVNGIGGSGDFLRNAYLSIVVCPSVAKDGRISTIVPMVSHMDQNEHSIQVIVTEQGLADLRGLGPQRRAERIIEHCAHPAYRDYLRGYLREARQGHLRHDLSRCFELHQNLLAHGAMLPRLEV
ncbi:MAG: succinate CoA transferase [Bacteroidota bacterium]